jgi:hypothetical protein
MIKEVIKKDEHQCSVCGRISAAKSVLKEVKGKNGFITYRCTNSKKCSANKKKGLPKDYLKMLKSRRKEKKKVIVEKKAETKKAERVEAPATA